MAQAQGALLVGVLLLAGVFGGCFGHASERGQVDVKQRGAPLNRAPVNETPIEKRLGQRILPPGNAVLGEWSVLSASAGPKGNLTGARFTIPVGGLIGFQYAGQRGLALEVAPIVVGGATIQQWCLLAFREAGGKAFMVGHPMPSSPLVGPIQLGGNIPALGATCSFDQERLIKSPGAADNHTKTAAQVTPLFIRFQDAALKELTDLYFVLGAVADREAPFGLAIRVLAEYPNLQARAADSLEVFVAHTGGTRPHAVKTLGTGQGLQVAWVSSSYGTGPSNSLLSSNEQWGGPVKPPAPVADGRPATALWNFNLTTSLDGASGWSLTSGEYGSFCGTGKWTASAQLNGQNFLARNLILDHPICGALYGFLAEFLLVGLPEFEFYGGGTGASRASLEIIAHDAGPSSFEFRHIAIGESLEHLIVFPSARGEFTVKGATQDLPPR